jgi:hypothetical protein
MSRLKKAFVAVGCLFVAAQLTTSQAMSQQGVSSKTWIAGGVFGDADAGQKAELTLNQPQVLGFRWRSSEPGAATGFWELRQQATGLVGERVLATGIADDDPTKSGVQGFFKIDLVKYLPPKPPTTGSWTYHVRIKPLPVQRPALQKAPDRSMGKAADAVAVNAVGAKDPAGVGPWSAPVVIHYSASTTPSQTFGEMQGKSQSTATRAQPAERQQREHLQKLQARLQAVAVEWDRTAMKRFEDDRRAFLEKRAATLQAENAKVRAQIERLRREGQ